MIDKNEYNIAKRLLNRIKIIDALSVQENFEEKLEFVEHYQSCYPFINRNIGRKELPKFEKLITYSNRRHRIKYYLSPKNLWKAVQLGFGSQLYIDFLEFKPKIIEILSSICTRFEVENGIDGHNYQ